MFLGWKPSLLWHIDFFYFQYVGKSTNFSTSKTFSPRMNVCYFFKNAHQYCLLWTFDIGYSHWCKVMYYCHFDLHSPVTRDNDCFPIPIGHVYLFFEKVGIKFPVIFLRKIRLFE